MTKKAPDDREIAEWLRGGREARRALITKERGVAERAPGDQKGAEWAVAKRALVGQGTLIARRAPSA